MARKNDLEQAIRESYEIIRPRKTLMAEMGADNPDNKME